MITPKLAVHTISVALRVIVTINVSTAMCKLHIAVDVAADEAFAAAGEGSAVSVAHFALTMRSCSILLLLLKTLYVGRYT